MFFVGLLFCSSLLIFFSSSLTLAKMPKDGHNSNGLGDAHLALWESKISRADECQIRSECFIPRFIKIRFDEEKSGAVVRSDYHEVCLYETMFRASFRLTFLLIV